MPDFIDLLHGTLNEKTLGLLTEKIGGKDTQQTAAASSAIISTMMSALNKNVNHGNGADALLGALDRDHDGSIIDDLGDLLAGKKAPVNTRAVNGRGILNHVLGDRQDNTLLMISKMSGMDLGKSWDLMKILAPVVMGGLGKEKKRRNLNAGGLADLLGSTVQSATHKSKEMSVIERMLDKDNDGSVLDDLSGMGMKLLSKFMKK